MKPEKIMTKTLTLSNRVTMPQFGFGTYLIPDDETGAAAVMTALKTGYRLIDTAEYYQNETMIGHVIKSFLAQHPTIKRQELFITSKIWNNHNQYDTAKTAFYAILKRLQVDYLDLCLLHWPTENSLEAWKLLTEMYQQKKVRAIGVSNFTVKQLKALIKVSKIKPMVNQIEMHPGFNQTEIVQYCQANDIIVTGWRTMIGGKADQIPLLVQLAKKYQTSANLIALRWAWQLQTIVIPKSVNSARIKSNTMFEHFTLTANEIENINQLPQKRIGMAPNHFAWEENIE